MTYRSVLATVLAIMLSWGVTGSAATSSADGPGEPGYIFTQQHRDDLYWWNGTWLPQTVQTGAHIQVQLPGDPIRWIPDQSSQCRPTRLPAGLPGSVRFLGSGELPSEGRIDGAAKVYWFDYRVLKPGVVAICLRPDPGQSAPHPLGLLPGSPRSYVLTLVAVRSVAAAQQDGDQPDQRANRHAGAEGDAADGEAGYPGQHPAQNEQVHRAAHGEPASEPGHWRG